MLETYVRICYDKDMMNREEGMSSQNVTRGIKKADIILIAVCLLTSVLIGVFLIVHRKEGSTMRILYDGTVLAEIAFDARHAESPPGNADGYYLVTFIDDKAMIEYFKDMPEPEPDEETGYNLISVTDGTVAMESADCADQICVHHMPVSSARESIICLPHRLVVEVAGSRDTDEGAYGGIQDDGPGEMSDEPLDGVVR